MVRGSDPGGGEIFHTRPDRPWDPPSLLYNGYWLSPGGVKHLGCGIDYPPPSSTEVKERVLLYLYSSSGPLWTVLGWPLPFIVSSNWQKETHRLVIWPLYVRRFHTVLYYSFYLVTERWLSTESKCNESLRLLYGLLFPHIA